MRNHNPFAPVMPFEAAKDRPGQASSGVNLAAAAAAPLDQTAADAADLDDADDLDDDGPETNAALRKRIAELESASATGPRVTEPDNVEMALNGHILTVKVDMRKDYGLSTSGKTVTVASTRGNKRFDVKGIVDPIFVGVNVYRKAPRK